MVKIGQRVASPPRRAKALQERVQKRAAQLQSGTHITQLAEPRQNIALLQSRRTRHRFLAPSSLFGESRRRWEKNHRRLEGRKLAKAAKKMAESGSDDVQAQALRDLPFHQQGGSDASHESIGPNLSFGPVDELSLSLESTAIGSFWDFPELASFSEDDSAKTALLSDLPSRLMNETLPDGELQLDEITELCEIPSPDPTTAQAFVGQRLQKPHHTFQGNVPPLISEGTPKIFSRPLDPEKYSSRLSMNRSSRDPYLTGRTRIGAPANVFWSVSSSGTSSRRRSSLRPKALRFDELREGSSTGAGLNSSGVLLGRVLDMGVGSSTGPVATVVGTPTAPTIKEQPHLHSINSSRIGFPDTPVIALRSAYSQLRTQYGSPTSLQKEGINRFSGRKVAPWSYETPKAGPSSRFALQDTPRMTHMAVIAPKIHARLALDMSTAQPVMHSENQRPPVSTPIQVYRWRPAGHVTPIGTEQAR